MSYFPTVSVPNLSRAHFLWGPNPTLSPDGTFGPIASAVGSGQVQVVNSPGSILVGHYRQQYTTGTGANAVAGVRSTVFMAHTVAGFRIKWRFACELFTSGQRGFVGLSPNAAAFPSGAVEPSTLTNIIAFAFDSTMTNWHVMHNDASGTATQVDTTIAINATDLLEGELSIEPSGSTVTWSLRNVTTGARASGTSSGSGNVPGNAALGVQMQANAAASGAAARLTHLLMSLECGPS